MPLVWNCIVKTGSLTKLPSIESTIGKSSKSWNEKYFVLYNPNLNVEKNIESPDKDLSCDDITAEFSSVALRKRPSLVDNSIIRKIRQLGGLRKSESQICDNIETACLLYYENREKELKGAIPKSKRVFYYESIQC